MKVSVRYKLLSYMLISVVIYIVLFFIANTFFIEKYYIEQKKKILLENSNKIEFILAEDFEKNGISALPKEDMQTINNTISVSGISVVAGDSKGNIIYPYVQHANEYSQINDSDFISINIISSNNLGTTSPFIDINLDSEEIIDKSSNENFIQSYSISTSERAALTNIALGMTPSSTYEILSNGTEDDFFAIISNDTENYQTLCYQKELSNGLMLLSTIPMSIISEGVAITNRFTTIIGVIVIFITIILAFITSGKFTKPIKEINQITEQMSKLDFSKSIKITGNDEIAELSKNVNSLSSCLDEAICQLNEKNKQLIKDIDREREIDKMRKMFIANVSHELKTPIFLIQGYAEGLKANLFENKEKKHFYCSVISEEADKMDLLVKDLLTLSRLEQDKLPLNKTDFNINELIENTLEKYKYIFEQKNIKVNLDFNEIYNVYADKEKLEQVLNNLINNAVDHIQGYNKLNISTECMSDKIKVTVFNTGNSIPEKNIQMLWDSFYKVDESHSRKLGGAGLGLSIVKAIMKSHGMPYGVENCNDGVEFWFCCSIIK